MDDRELLEKAAKAAGLVVKFSPATAVWEANGCYLIEDGEAARWWNPLHDDGDAIRMAAALRMVLDFSTSGVAEVRFWLGGEEYPRRNVVPRAEWRRAVTLAAVAFNTRAHNAMVKRDQQPAQADD